MFFHGLEKKRERCCSGEYQNERIGTSNRCSEVLLMMQRASAQADQQFRVCVRRFDSESCLASCLRFWMSDRHSRMFHGSLWPDQVPGTEVSVCKRDFTV